MLWHDWAMPSSNSDKAPREIDVRVTYEEQFEIFWKIARGLPAGCASAASAQLARNYGFGPQIIWDFSVLPEREQEGALPGEPGMLSFFKSLRGRGVMRDTRLSIAEVVLTTARSIAWPKPVPVLELRPRALSADDPVFSWRSPSMNPIAQVPILHNGQPERNMDLLRGYGHTERLIEANQTVIITAEFNSDSDWSKFSTRLVVRARVLGPSHQSSPEQPEVRTRHQEVLKCDCGTRIRKPATSTATRIRCPRCQTIHTLS
jgi:hypothetical protein